MKKIGSLCHEEAFFCEEGGQMNRNILLFQYLIRFFFYIKIQVNPTPIMGHKHMKVPLLCFYDF